MSGERSAQRHHRRLGPAICLLAVAVLAIPATQPLLTGQLTAGFDNVLHLWRALEVDRLLDAGILYTRWQPHMALGFGYPLLLFNPPLSPLLTALSHRAGLEWPAALNAVFVLGTILSAWTMWLLVRDDWSDEGGLVAAAVILTVPFHAFLNFDRASVSEALAWAFPGLVLWGLNRWQRLAQTQGLLAASGGLAAMMLSHDASTYLLLPMAAAAVAATAWAQRSARSLGRGVLALLLGMTLAAFSWLPSVAERHAVQYDRAMEGPYEANFIPFDYLLEPPRQADPTLLNPWLSKSVGLIPALVALTGLPACIGAGNRHRRCWLLAILLTTVASLLLASPLGLPIYRLAPWLGYLQSPWRFLTPATFGVAILAGAGVGWLRQRAPLATPLAVTALLLGGLGWLFPAHTSLPQPVTLAGMLAHERGTGQLGSTTFSELLPVWVQQLPEGEPLEEDLIAGREPARLRPEDLPPGASVLQAEYRPNRARVVLESPVPFTARYLTFYFPGWQVWVDGEQVPVGPTDPEGLLAFDLPAGSYTVLVRFGTTPLRRGADALSALALLALLALAVWRARRRPAPPGGAPATPSSVRPAVAAWCCLLPALALVAFKLALVDHLDTPFRFANLEGDHLRRVDVPAGVTFDDQFRLLGSDALPQGTPSDRPLEIRTYWQDLVPGGPDYQVALALEDGRGLAWSDPFLRPGRWQRELGPTHLWPPDGYALVAQQLQPLPGTPPGVYTVTLAVFELETRAPYTARDVSGLALGPQIVLGQVHIDRPHHPPDPGAALSQYRADAVYGPLRLVGFNLDRAEAAPGDPFLLTLFWQAEQAPAANLVARLRLLDRSGREVATFTLAPVDDAFPTSVWQPGEVWRGQHAFRIPAHLESGRYRWGLDLCQPATDGCLTLGQETVLGELEVQAPERLWTVPPLDLSANVCLGGVVTLLGADLQPDAPVLPPGQTVTVTLAWRAESEMTTSYRVFLHLLGPDGSLVAQADGEPAGWTRPTTGWLPGEVVLDRRELVLPPTAAPGEYALRAGLYTPEEGRLRSADGADAVELLPVTVGEP